MFAVRVAQPLPLEVEPPHADLFAERRLAIAQLRLAVLPPIEVVVERVERALGEGARDGELRATGRRLAFVDRREVGRADWLRGEWRESEHDRRYAREEQLPSKEGPWAPDEDGEANGGRREHPGHVIGVSEAEEI